MTYIVMILTIAPLTLSDLWLTTPFPLV